MVLPDDALTLQKRPESLYPSNIGVYGRFAEGLAFALWPSRPFWLLLHGNDEAPQVICGDLTNALDSTKEIGKEADTALDVGDRVWT